MDTITVCCATCDYDEGQTCPYMDEDFDGRCMNWCGQKAVEARAFREACKKADAAKADAGDEIELLDLDTYDFADIDEDDF